MSEKKTRKVPRSFTLDQEAIDYVEKAANDGNRTKSYIVNQMIINEKERNDGKTKN